jgi:hypothetical protein
MCHQALSPFQLYPFPSPVPWFVSSKPFRVGWLAQGIYTGGSPGPGKGRGGSLRPRVRCVVGRIDASGLTFAKTNERFSSQTAKDTVAVGLLSACWLFFDGVDVREEALA